MSDCQQPLQTIHKGLDMKVPSIGNNTLLMNKNMKLSD